MAWGGPMLMTWTSPPYFSLVKRPSSRANSSKGLVMLATPSRINVFVSGLIFTSVVSGTCFRHTAIFTFSSLSSLVLIFPFFEEGLHSFLLILGREAEAEGIGLHTAGFSEIQIETAIDNHLGESDANRSIPCNLSCDLFRFFHQRGLGKHPIRNAHLKGLLSRNHLARVDQFFRLCLSDQPWESLSSPKAGEDAKRHFRQPKAGIFRSVDEITG